MNCQIINRFDSKRNEVYLVACGQWPKAVLKRFERAQNLEAERRTAQALWKSGVTVPKILQAEGNDLLYQYIEGTVLVDYLEQLEQAEQCTKVFLAFDRLAAWLASCYKVLEREYGCQMSLGDAHLRNFIDGDQIYGIDFECLRSGPKEADIAAIAAFTLTYTPMLTPQKYRLAAYFLQRAGHWMALDANTLHQEVNCALQIIEQRRGIRFPENLAARLFAITEENPSPQAEAVIV